MTDRHPLFQAVVTGQYTLGLELHAAQEFPSGADDRWAGYCLFALKQFLPAKDLLLRAKAKGCSAAGLELALVLRYLGETQAARSELNGIDLATLAPLDRAYALREQAAAALYEGRPGQAREALELAWSALVSLGETGMPLVASTAQLLGYTYALLGREAPALHYLGVALQQATGGKRVHGLHTRAQVHLYAGRYGDAQLDLQESRILLSQEPVAEAYQPYLEGLLQRALGMFPAALDAFRQAAQRARETSETSTEFLAELGSASVLTAQYQLEEARTHLLRARPLVINTWHEALYALRQGAWEEKQGSGSAMTVLERARQLFVVLELPRETAWVDLHLAKTQLDRDQMQAVSFLKRAAEASHVLGSGASLLPELQLLPSVTALLQRHSMDPALQVLARDLGRARERTPGRVELLTLGKARVVVDGVEIRLGMRRTLEVLVFVLRHGSVTREHLLSHLWADEDPRRAANYFHQVKHELLRTLPHVQIAYDKTLCTYSVRCEGPELWWDAQVVKRGLSALDEDTVVRAIEGYKGPFLPDAVTAWAHEERDELEWSVVKAGLQLMARWSEAGEYSKCATLSRRLLEIDPCDEGLAEYLMEATLKLEGVAAAQRALVEVGGRAARELDHPPQWMERLSRRVLPPN